MNKYVDFVIGSTLSVFIFLIWYFKSLFSATPNNFYFGIAALILFNLAILTKVYCTYLSKTNLVLANSVLVFFLLCCWFSTTKTSFTYNYYLSDTIINLLCFILATIQFLCIISNGVNKVKNNNKNRSSL
jgi:hypothetical protein